MRATVRERYNCFVCSTAKIASQMKEDLRKYLLDTFDCNRDIRLQRLIKREPQLEAKNLNYFSDTNKNIVDAIKAKYY